MQELRGFLPLNALVAFVCLHSCLGAQTTSTPDVTLQAASYPGADAGAKINACVAAVIQAGGGVCDATGLGGQQNFAEEVEVGSAQSMSARIGVTLLLPDSATWQWQVSNPASCGIHQFSGTAIVGHQPGGGGSNMILTALSGSSMDSLYCTDVSGGYVRAEGFSAFNHEAGNTFANGVVHIQNVVDESSFTRIFAGNYYGDSWHVAGACCGTKFENIQGISNGAISNGAQGGIPLTIGPGVVDGVAFYDSTFNDPGEGFPNIHIVGDGYVTQVWGVTFFNAYMEGNGLVDSTTSMVIIDPYVGPIHFHGGAAKTELAQPNTKAVFENHGYQIDLSGFDVIGANIGVNDVTNNVKIGTWGYNKSYGAIPNYSTPE
jgi:hypothetical protein